MAPSSTTWTPAIAPSVSWIAAAPPTGSVSSQVTSTTTSTTTTSGSGDTLAYDFYAGTPGDLLQNRTGDSGVTYAKHPTQTGGGSAVIGSSNDIYCNGFGAGLEYIIYANPADADYASMMSFNMFSDIAGQSDGIGIGVRYDPTALTRYLLWWNNTTVAWDLYRTVVGSDTLLGSISTVNLLGTSNPRAVRLAAQGNGSRVTLTATIDGTDIMVIADTAAGRITATGQPGMRWFNSTSAAQNNSKLHMDNLIVKTLSSVVTSTTTSVSTTTVQNALWNATLAPSAPTWQS